MTDETKHDNATGHGSFEHQDLRPPGVLYFLLTLVIVIVVCLFGLRGLYGFLDRREKASQPEVNPLVTAVPGDTRYIAPGYPQAVFPNPKLEEDERGQLNGIRLREEQTLYSYGWVDENAGTVRIPIERAMDLLVQRGLPVHALNASDESASAKVEANKSKAQNKKGEKK